MFRHVLLCLAALTICFAGCSAEPGISGTVNKSGEPLSSGTITFTPKAGGEPFTADVFDGAFSLKRGGLAGDYKVSVKVSFAADEHAAEFYKNLEAAASGGAPAEAEDKEEEKVYEFDETFTNGPNTLEYNLD